MEKLKVLIVDDDAFQRKNISEIVDSTEMAGVVRTFGSGSLALEWLEHNNANVVLLDAVLLEDNSLDILRSIKKKYAGIEVIMVSDGRPGSVDITLKGLKHGALDFIQKSSVKDPQIRNDSVKNQLIILFSQIVIKMNSYKNTSSPDAAGINYISHSRFESKDDPVKQFDALRWKEADLVLITASTGGPAALEVVCSMFPADFTKPVLIVQHIPSEFTRALIESLNKKCLVPVAEGKEGDVVRRRSVLMAPGGYHMVVEGGRGEEKTIRLKSTPHVNGVRPAADVLFKSVAGAYEDKNILVIILTGMGSDGLSGVEEIKKKCNCYCIVQSEKTCVVYGMPRSVYEAGLADEVVDLQEITPRMCQIIAGRS
ncbi:MAG: chemotaxis-specific protein-glutamate methyltransferase CheB [Syntrophomonas sp.]